MCILLYFKFDWEPLISDRFSDIRVSGILPLISTISKVVPHYIQTNRTIIPVIITTP